MAVTALKRNIPTVAEAIEKFVSVHQHRRGVREHISVLVGPRTGRVTGRKAAGPTLARSNLGGLRFDRVTGPEFAAWFHERHPAGLAAPTLKRGRSSLRQLLLSAIENGWADEAVLAIAAHQLAWCALGRARLDGPLKPSAEYERALHGLLARFLASDSLPSAEAFAETVRRCLDELAGAHAAGTLVRVERDRAWRRAARWLGGRRRARAGDPAVGGVLVEIALTQGSSPAS